MDDPRRQELAEWCAGVLGHGEFELAAASADASFRRYFRVHAPDGTRIAMDARPRNCGSQERFVQVASLLRDAGVHAPTVHAQDLERGFLLLEDLGARTYLEALDGADADALFNDAIGALVRLQGIPPPDDLPRYDRALLRAELELFPDWFVAHHLERALTPGQRDGLAECFRLIEDAALEQPRVFVHRDYMPRNLLVSEPNPGVIDFQDAVAGPVSYDAVSLFRDAFVSWPADRLEAWVRDYLREARAAGLPVGDDEAFRRAFDWMGVQRHLKVIGIFARLCYRDGKPAYLADTPRFFGYLYYTARRYRELVPLLRVLDEIGAAEAAARAPREAPAAGEPQ